MTTRLLLPRSPPSLSRSSPRLSRPRASGRCTQAARKGRRRCPTRSGQRRGIALGRPLLSHACAHPGGGVRVCVHSSASALVASSIVVLPRPPSGSSAASSHPLPLLSPSLKRALPKWRSTLCAPSSASAPRGAPLMLAVCASAERCLAVLGALRPLRLPQFSAVKAFARHLSVDEQRRHLQQHDVRVLVGTPRRICALIDAGDLRLDRLELVLVDGAEDGQRRQRSAQRRSAAPHSTDPFSRCAIPPCAIRMCSEALHPADAAGSERGPVRAIQPPPWPTAGTADADVRVLTAVRCRKHA